MSRQSPRLFKPRPSAWKQSAQFKIEEVAPLRKGDPPYSRTWHNRTSHAREPPDDALGEKLMTRGEHRFVLNFVLNNELGSTTGHGIILGTASADGRQKVGIRCWDGRVITLPKREKQPAGDVLAPLIATRTERAVHSRVEVIVDLFRRSIGFSIDGGTPADSGLLPHEVPEQLVPWACTVYKGDVVILSNHRYRKVLGTPPTPPAPVRVPPSKWNWEDDEHDAGPWTR